MTSIATSYLGQNGSRITAHTFHIFRVIGLSWGESTGHRWIPSQRPAMRSFAVFSDRRLKKRLSKQHRPRWFEMQSWSLWRHCKVVVGYYGMHIGVYSNGCLLTTLMHMWLWSITHTRLTHWDRGTHIFVSKHNSTNFNRRKWLKFSFGN